VSVYASAPVPSRNEWRAYYIWLGRQRDVARVAYMLGVERITVRLAVSACQDYLRDHDHNSGGEA
jgi:hypothetical protein